MAKAKRNGYYAENISDARINNTKKVACVCVSGDSRAREKRIDEKRAHRKKGA